MSNKKEIVGDLAEGKAMECVVDVHEFDVSAKKDVHELIDKIQELVSIPNVDTDSENAINGIKILNLLVDLRAGVSVKYLKGGDLPSAKLVSDLKECTDFQSKEISKLKTDLSESEDLQSIPTENGLATQSKVTDLKGFADLQDKMIDNLNSRNQELIANLYETKILADDRQNQILKLKQENQELNRVASNGISALRPLLREKQRLENLNQAITTHRDTLKDTCGKLQKDYDNLIDSGAKDAVIAKDRIDELTNTIHELNSQLNEFGAMP